MTAAVRMKQPNGSVHKRTVRKAHRIRMFDRMADDGQDLVIDTWYFSEDSDRDALKQRRERLGWKTRTYSCRCHSGRNLVSSFVRTDEYSETATAPRAVRIEPMTPAKPSAR